MDADAYEASIIEAYEAKLREKDAEIERLKEDNAHFAWRDKDKDILITELCDALAGASKWPPHQLLIQRAREATR